MNDPDTYTRMLHLIEHRLCVFVCLSLQGCLPCVQAKRVFKSCLPDSSAYDSIILELDRYSADDRRLIRELKIRTFPQIRLYRSGKLVSAVEGGFAGDDFTAIDELRGWLSPLLETQISESFA